MATMNDSKGCSTCKAGQENYQRYKACNKKYYYQYDYRTEDGQLFSCVAKTLEECREKRDKWLNKLNNK